MNNKPNYNIKKALFYSYSLRQKLGFVFNVFQSSFSELFFGLLYWYVFDKLFSNIGNYLFALVLLFAVTVYFTFLVPLWGYWMESGQSKAKESLSNDLANRLFKYSPSFISRIHSSHILNLFQEDIPNVVELGGWKTVVLFQSVVSGVAAGISFLLIKWQLLIILLVFGTMPLMVDYLFAKKNQLMLSEIREAYDKRLELLSDSIDNYTIIKIYNACENNVNAFNNYTDQIVRKQIRVNTYNNIISFVHDFIYNTVFRTVVLIGGAFWWSRGEMTIGEIAFLFSMTEGLGFFLNDFGAYIRNIQSIIVSKKKLEDFYDNNQYQELIEYYSQEIHKITLEDLSFRYPGKTYDLLSNINYEFETGNKYLIRGKNGIGKSTLVKILIGMYKPSKGKVLANDSVFKYGNRRIAYVPQEPKLFAGTLEDNLIIDETLSQDQVQHILNVVELGEFTLEYIILENGVNLSRGQKERIALARALINAPDVLIMDEFDANLDENTFDKILYNIQRYYKHSCIIAITHNPEKKGYKNFVHIMIDDGLLLLDTTNLESETVLCK